MSKKYSANLVIYAALRKNLTINKILILLLLEEREYFMRSNLFGGKACA